MKLIIGLGNPGNDYINTRHNIGFSVLDYIAKDKNLSFKKEKFNAIYTDYVYNDEKILLIKPLSYMNLSGEVVKKFVDFYKIDINDILVIHDDLDMSLGRIKICYDSSSGGHNGIKDIEKNIGSKMYTRLKIGISNDKMIDTKDYVLSKFSSDELKILDYDYKILENIIEDFCDYDLDKLMNKYNKKI